MRLPQSHSRLIPRHLAWKEVRSLPHLPDPSFSDSGGRGGGVDAPPRLCRGTLRKERSPSRLSPGRRLTANLGGSQLRHGPGQPGEDPTARLMQPAVAKKGVPPTGRLFLALRVRRGKAGRGGEDCASWRPACVSVWTSLGGVSFVIMRKWV